jgi:serine/threonine protein kinase
MTAKPEKMLGQRMKTFNFLSILGKGAWALVYEAIDDRDGSQVAIKVIPKILIKQVPKL